MWKRNWGFFVRRKDTLIIVAKEWDEVQTIAGVDVVTRQTRAVTTLLEYTKKVAGDIDIRLTDGERAVALEIFGVDRIVEKEIKEEFLKLLKEAFEGR